jgi:hypothetical protein
LITDHLDIYLACFTESIPRHNIAKLAQLYRLLARIPSGLDACYVSFEKHVRQAGLDSVEAAVALGSSTKPTTEVPSQRESVNPTYFSESLTNVIIKYQKIVQFAFNSDKEFNRSLGKACRAFLNWNRACIYDSDAPELLAKHTENLLRRTGGSAISESDLLEKLVDSVSTRYPL